MKPSVKIATPTTGQITATVGFEAKRVLILMSDTGGGHRAAAEAIQEGFEFLYGSRVAVTVVDAWKDYLAWPINRLADTYGWMVNEALWLWKGLWRLEKHPAFINAFYGVVYPLVRADLLNLFISRRPDLIVSVHPLLTQFGLQVLERSGLSIPFVTVVTDLIQSWHVWYRPSTTLCLVPSHSIARLAVRLGVSPDKVSVVGQPVTLKLSAKVGAKQMLRRRLGLHPERPVILVAGGGEGYGSILEIGGAVANKLKQAQLIIVAGRNESLRKKLDEIEWQIPTVIFGFVKNMPELMQAADVFVTKAGPGSISEAFVAGLPLILFDYIPGQEEANVQYVLQHDAGVYVSSPDKIAKLLSTWLRPGNGTLAQMAHNASQLARPDAALTIARRAYQLIV